MVVLVVGPGGAEHDACALVAGLHHEVHGCEPGAVPPSLLVNGAVDAVIVDLAARQDALKFLRRRGRADDLIPVVCIAARRGVDTAADALRLGAIDIIGRPLQAASVGAALDNAREYAAGPRPDSDAPAAHEDDGLFGPSRAMLSVLDLSRRAAASRCPVLIVGERGTGRETVARAIHTGTGRGVEGFVRLMCPGLTEREFDEACSRPSVVTLYLDEIAELGHALQARLEARLEDWTSGPRVIAGALPRLWDALDRGAIRRGLVDALSIVRIDLEPLRQRRDDIPLLALRFLKQACLDGGTPSKTFSRAALTLLAAMPWPGNAAQVKSLCERLAIVVPRGVVQLEDVLANVRLDAAAPLDGPREPLKNARERFEREYIVAMLREHRGRIGPAARELGIERTNLYRKMKQLQIRGARGTESGPRTDKTV